MKGKGNYIKNNISDSNKPNFTNSERKRQIKNVDNNISYSDSDEEKNKSNINDIIKNDNSYEDDNIQYKDGFCSKKLNVKNNNINSMSIRPNNNNYNNNFYNRNTSNKNNVKNKNLKYSGDSVNCNRGISEQINTQQKRSVSDIYITDKKSSGYSDFFLSNKRAFSGEKKNYRTNHLFHSPAPSNLNLMNRLGYSEKKFQNMYNTNNALCPNYVPTNSKTKVTKIERAHQEEINNNIKNINQNFCSIGINSYEPVNNSQNMIFDLNIKSPKLNVGNIKTKVKKLPNKKIEERANINYTFNNSLNPMNSNDINILPIKSENLLKQENELPGGNNTFGFFPLRKPLSSNDLNNHSYQRLDSDTSLPRTSNDNLLLSNYYSNDRLIQNTNDMNSSNIQRSFIKNRNEDNKYHNLYLTMNYLNRPTAFNDMNFHPLPMPSINNGRVTIVKKLPLLDCVDNNINKTDLVESINPNSRQKVPIINNQFNKPIMNINDGRNTFTNNINVKKLVNKKNPNSNEENISNERKSNPNLISNNLLNNQINGIIHNQRINIPPNQRYKINNNKLSEKKNININFNNQQLNLLLNDDCEQIKLKDKNHSIIGQQKNPLKPLNNIQIINSEYSDFIQNQNNFNQNDSIRQNLNPNQEISKNINLSNNIESIRNLNTNKIDEKNQDETEEKEEEQNENIRSENQNNIPKKNNVDISYNDFDGSGWIKNYGGVSRPGKDMYGNQKINQDSFVCLTNINNIKDFNIFGVLDGHGPEGHYVSEFASDYIPSQITNNTEIKKLENPEKIYEKLKENNCQIITKAFLSCDEQLKKVDFDSYDSGSTCILVIHIGAHIICANVGDSRAIVAYDDHNDPELNNLESAQLSIDYKPELPNEKNRILMSGGDVEQMKDEYGQKVGPYRVWARGKDYPGLAMSRSIGDLKGKIIGVVPDPGIMEYDLCESSKYITICSDGVWEFLSNEVVTKIGKFYYLEDNASEFCHQIINNSVYMWQKNENNIDDITVVAVFF